MRAVVLYEVGAEQEVVTGVHGRVEVEVEAPALLGVKFPNGAAEEGDETPAFLGMRSRWRWKSPTTAWISMPG